MARRQPFATFIVGKSVLIREGIARILSAGNFRTLASVSCADDLSPNKLQSHPSLVLIVHAGDDFEAAVEQIELLRERHPKARIAIVADHYRLDEMVSAFRAGASGYFIDVMTCDVFIKSIELVMMGETIFPPAFMSSILHSESDHFAKAAPRNDNNRAIAITADRSITQQLSPREKSIMQCLISGDSNKCIARKIDIAEATVKVHVKAILRKIRVQNRTQAAIWGMNHGSLVRPINDVANTSEQFPDSLSIAPDIKQIEGLVRRELIDQPTNRVEAPNRGRLIRNGMARLGK
ncbi:response regulator transcription factor [Bradyrhizobium sp. AUGA SZCCT0283]|uniref:LuxR C-terminal-related transcriptional regulator n=1 Tax=Bradyrhizobium sp. AUGA SZCCT0283 TaxID=2807671 RepID=UPI001BAAAAE1|nr:response regulator transcription factor [Bradyrhizobium sp. AUGA SZCCT0283]MBR1279934.1 response regulator transcription factor [Bradyrhizobium sp. AUGA SZCCT0283]